MLQRQQENPLINQIRMMFYNFIVNGVYDDPTLTKQNLDTKTQDIIKEIIHVILRRSDQNTDTIRLPDNLVLSHQNCPFVYLPLLQGILQIKNLSRECDAATIDARIRTLATAAMSMPSFQEIIPSVKKFIYDLKGFITPDDIRETFYNEMPNQAFDAIQKGLITSDDLEAQEPYIYFALPALTLLHVVYQSRDVEGIRLFNGKILTAENCPHEEEFFELFSKILAIKKDLLTIAKSRDEWKILTELCLSKGTGESEFKTPLVIRCSSLINAVSSVIGQRQVFKEKIDEQLQFCHAMTLKI